MQKTRSADLPSKEITQRQLEVFIQKSESARLVAHPHVHSALEFIYILNGKHKVYANDDEFDMSDGDLCLFRSETVHRIYALDADGGRYFVIKIDPSMIQNLLNEEHGISYIMQFLVQKENTRIGWTSEQLKNSEILFSINRLLDEYLSAGYAKDYAMKIYASKLLLDILRHENTNNSAPFLLSSDISLSQQIYKAMMYINSNYATDISASECAEYINMSYSYFSRSFKRITGKSFKEHLNFIRINRAEKLLLSTDKTITEICFACGYNNVSYFISQYRLLRGKTPNTHKNEKSI